jgi:hypothetical protein
MPSVPNENSVVKLKPEAVPAPPTNAALQIPPAADWACWEGVSEPQLLSENATSSNVATHIKDFCQTCIEPDPENLREKFLLQDYRDAGGQVNGCRRIRAGSGCGKNLPATATSFTFAKKDGILMSCITGKHWFHAVTTAGAAARRPVNCCDDLFCSETKTPFTPFLALPKSVTLSGNV